MLGFERSQGTNFPKVLLGSINSNTINHNFIFSYRPQYTNFRLSQKVPSDTYLTIMYVQRILSLIIEVQLISFHNQKLSFYMPFQFLMTCWNKCKHKLVMLKKVQKVGISLDKKPLHSRFSSNHAIEQFQSVLRLVHLIGNFHKRKSCPF